jgi:hypothetical protein
MTKVRLPVSELVLVALCTAMISCSPHRSAGSGSGSGPDGSYLEVACPGCQCSGEISQKLLSDAYSVALRVSLPVDSVIVRREGVDIVFSMQDVRDYFERLRFDPGGWHARFYSEIRAQYQQRGWVEITSEMKAEHMVAHLLSAGRATVRSTASGQAIGCVFIVHTQAVEGPILRAGRSFYLPTGQLLLAVIDRVSRG